MKSKFTLSALLILSVFQAIAAEYKYQGFPISERVYQKLWKSWKNKLATDDNGKVYFMIPEVQEKIYGSLQEKVCYSVNAVRSSVGNESISMELLDKNKKYAAGFYIKRKDFKKGINNKFIILPKSQKKGVRIGGYTTILSPITETQFKTYLDSGQILHRVVKKEDIPVQYGPCNSCKKGMIKNPNYSKKKLGARKYLKCPECKGSGKMITAAAVYKYIKKPLLHPKAKKSLAKATK